MKIVNICLVPELELPVARLCFSEWREECVDAGIGSVSSYVEHMKDSFVFVADSCLLGTVTVERRDMRRPETPWLSSLLVLPGARGRGVGSALVSFVMARFDELYLWAHDDVLGFYTRLGFTVLERCTYLGAEVSVCHWQSPVPSFPSSHCLSRQLWYPLL